MYGVNNPVRFIDPDGMGIFDAAQGRTMDDVRAMQQWFADEWAAQRAYESMLGSASGYLSSTQPVEQETQNKGLRMEFVGEVKADYYWYAAENQGGKIVAKLDADGNKILIGQTQLVEGTLSIYDKDNKLIFSTIAVSGAMGNGAAPDGEYTLGNPYRKQKPQFTPTGDPKFDFRIDFRNSDVTRTGLQIHTESDMYSYYSNGQVGKNNPQTWGCIAIVGGAKDAKTFYNYAKSLNIAKLIVDTNNPLAYKYDLFKIGGGNSGGTLRIGEKKIRKKE